MYCDRHGAVALNWVRAVRGCPRTDKRAYDESDYSNYFHRLLLKRLTPFAPYPAAIDVPRKLTQLPAEKLAQETLISNFGRRATWIVRRAALLRRPNDQWSKPVRTPRSLSVLPVSQ